MEFHNDDRIERTKIRENLELGIRNLELRVGSQFPVSDQEETKELWHAQN